MTPIYDSSGKRLTISGQPDQGSLCERKLLSTYAQCTSGSMGSNAPSEMHRNNSQRQLAGLYELSRKIGRSLNIDEVVKTALKMVLAIADPDVALLFLKQDDCLRLHHQITKSLDAPAIETPVHTIGECLCGLAFAKQAPVYSIDITHDPRCTMHECKLAGVISIAALPLSIEGSTLGVLALATQLNARDFSAHAAFLETMVSQIAAAIQNALLHQALRQRSDSLAQSITQLEKEIAERKSTQEALKRNARRMESIFRAAPIGIGLVVDRTLLEVNDRVCEMTGRTRRELIGQNALILYPSQSDYDFVGEEKYRQIRETGQGVVETVWRHKSGGIIDVLLSSVPMDPHQPKNGFTFSALDITLQKSAVNEIRALNADLEQRVAVRTAELADKNRELETFTYSVSHDLKAPLRAIDGYSRLLLEDYGAQLSDEATLYLSHIRNGTDQMNRLIDGLLAYSRMERRPLSSRKIDFGALIEEIVAKYQKDITERKIALSLVLDALSANIDAEGISVALRNLFDNAVKFTRDTALPAITIGTRLTETGLLVWVRDNGKGFDMAYQERIFEIFQRLEKAEEYPGTGIGLTMVRRAVERMGGRCWAESEPSRGATFYLEIPQ